MDQHAVEKGFLRDVDHAAARVHQKLLRSDFKELTNEDRNDWARFLMCLRVRQPKVVEMLRREATETLRKQLANQPEQYDELAGEGDPPTLTEWVDAHFPGLIENIGISYFSGLVDNEAVGTKILRLGWHLRTFRQEDRNLIIGDHPCIFTRGMDDPDLVIALPISPTRAFFAIRSERALDRIRRHSSRDLVTAINESTVAQARVRVYATDSSSKRFIENRLARRRSM